MNMVNLSPWQLLNLIDLLMGVYLFLNIDFLEPIFVLYIIKTAIYAILALPYIKTIVGILTIIDILVVVVYLLDINILFRIFGLYLIFKVISTSF